MALSERKLWVVKPRLRRTGAGKDGEVVEYLLASGAAPDDQENAALWSSLHFAAARGHVNVAEALLNHDAKVNPRDGRGLTPLDAARVASAHSMIALLLEPGAGLTLYR